MDRISQGQLAALTWAAVLAPAAELLPAVTLPIAGRGAWLAPLAASPLLLLTGALLKSAAGSRGLAAELRTALGKRAGGALLLLYMVWGELLLALRLRLCAQRLLEGGRRDGSLWYFLLGLAILALWMGLGRISDLARAGQMFLGVLLVTGAAVLALSLRGIRLERTLPLWGEDFGQVLRAAPPTAGVLSWGIYGAFLTGAMEAQSGKNQSWLRWVLCGCGALTISQWIILGNLGTGLAGRLEHPFFTLAKSVGVEGAFQRVESVVNALWTLSDLSMAAVLLLVVRLLLQELVPGCKGKWAAGGGILLAVLLAGIGFSDGGAEQWNQTLVPWVNLSLGLGIPSLLWVWSRGSKYSRKRGKKRQI